MSSERSTCSVHGPPHGTCVCMWPSYLQPRQACTVHYTVFGCTCSNCHPHCADVNNYIIIWTGAGGLGGKSDRCTHWLGSRLGCPWQTQRQASHGKIMGHHKANYDKFKEAIAACLDHNLLHNPNSTCTQTDRHTHTN